MVRLRVEAQLGGNTVLPELERHLILTKKNCRSTKSIFAKDFGHAEENDRTLYIHRMILQLGINLECGWIEWLETMIPALKNFEK